MSSPAERLEQALELADLAEEMMLLKLRRDHPNESDEEIERRLDAWFLHRPGAEHGDAEGVPVPLPRPRR